MDRPRTRQHVAPNAAGQGAAAAVAVHHAAIAAGKDQQRHHPLRQRHAAAEMGLEGEKIRGAVPAQRCANRAFGVPGAAGRDHDARADRISSPAIFAHRSVVSNVGLRRLAAAPSHLPRRLEQLRARRHRTRRSSISSRVLRGPAPRPHPAFASRQRRLHHRLARQTPRHLHAPAARRKARNVIAGHAARLQHRHGRRRG